MNKKSETLMVEIDHKNKTVEFFPAIDGWASTEEVEVLKISSIEQLIKLQIPEGYVEV